VTHLHEADDQVTVTCSVAEDAVVLHPDPHQLQTLTLLLLLLSTSLIDSSTLSAVCQQTVPGREEQPPQGGVARCRGY